MLGIFIGYLGVSRYYILSGYALCVITGIVFAEENLFKKIYDIKIVKNAKVSSVLKIGIYIILMYVLLIKLRGEGEFWYCIDVFAPILLGACMMECCNVISIIEKPMGFIGKHSMNIFLIHTLIFEYYFMDFIYGFKHWFLILLALLGTSLIVSIVIEYLKEKLGYNKLISRITKRINI